MENVVLFFYIVKSELEKLKSEKLNATRLQPTEIVVSKINSLARRKLEKSENLRKKVESGYISGIDKSIKLLDEIFEKYSKEQND